MSLKRLIFAGLLISCSGIVHAQYEEDGMRFSQSETGATARFKAMGNAQTALGGDLSSISGNPAGLGFFNTSDAAISFGYFGHLNKSTYYDNTLSKQEGYMDISQLGAVFNFPTRRFANQSTTSGWLNFNMGIGYSRTNDFRNNIELQGDNTNSSFTDMLADNADWAPYDVWGEDGYLVDYSEANGYYFPTTSVEFTNNQRNTDVRGGSQYDAHLSFGANYENRFYLGAFIGLSGFSYTSDRDFSEIGRMKDAAAFGAVAPGSEFLDPSNAAYDFLDADYELAYATRQSVRASGVKGTLGMIYKASEIVRIGFSATTPTWYNVTEDYSMYFDSWMIDPDTDNELLHYESPIEEYYDEYTLRTPYKLSAGLSAVFDQGLISADVDFVDYTSMRINNDPDATQIIKDNYTQAVNVRVGGEYKIAAPFMIRAGYGYRGSSIEAIDNSRQTISAGLGYRVNNIYMDLSYQNKTYNWEYTPYESYVNPTNPATINTTRNDVVLTLGVKF